MIPINEAEDYIFGMVLLNDWSSRHSKMGICRLDPSWQKFCIINITLIVTMDALEPFRASPKQDPSPLPYLQQKGKHSYPFRSSYSARKCRTYCYK
jgi:fumarylacetoacetase